PNVLDKLLWTQHSDVFSVEGDYQSLTQRVEDVELELNSIALVWNKVATINVLVFAWRFLANRIPTRDNLFKRGILNIDAQHCVMGCGSDETLSHLFFVCDLSYKVWCDVLQWLGVQSALHNIQVVHAQQFSGLHVRFLKYKNCFSAI
ncbi:70 kDa peptidyl-prolyl isomerase, partial [Trifolium medium]|nr:70 kDa peptidyl-prolyl isomerase [Trifolium medium]